MDFAQNAGLALTNLTSIPVLAFVLGVLAVTILRADLRLPDPVYRALSFYLLLAIGLKGGIALHQAGIGSVVVPALAAVALGVVIPLAAFHILRVVTALRGVDRGAMAAHYGSTSLVTFTAALAFVQAVGLKIDGPVATLVVIMEIPGIVIGLLLANKARSSAVQQRVAALATAGGGGSVTDVHEPEPAHPQREESGLGSAMREVLAGPTVLLMVGGLVIGYIAGPEGYEAVSPMFSGLFMGVLALFLLHLGVVAGMRMPAVRSAGLGLIVFAIVFPLLTGSIGVLVGSAIGMGAGEAAVLGVLCASASYIAAPAAVGLALPHADQGLCLTSSLGITFPFNLAVGVPMLTALAMMVS